MLIPNESFDVVIAKLLPAQQRTVRSIIPKLTEQEKEYVNTFKKARIQSTVPASRMVPQKSSREASKTKPTTAPAQLQKKESIAVETTQLLHDENNPLSMFKINPMLKRQRLAHVGKGDLWKDFPEEPAEEAVQALRKTWSGLIHSSTVRILLPSNGMNSMENYQPAMDLVMKSISDSKSSKDSIIIEQLDLVLKWATCVLASRDHTVALRKLLSVILTLFEKLHEQQHKIDDTEAVILLPYLLERAGKSPFHDQFLEVLSFVTSNGIYKTEQYGAQICVRVLEKSARSKSRLLATNQLESCVQAVGLTAIGKRGLVVLSKTLSTDNIVENRTAYLSLLELAVDKLNGDLGKLFSIVGTALSESAQCLIKERLSKRLPHETNERSVSIQQPSLKLRTPSRTNSARLSGISPKIQVAKSGSNNNIRESSPQVEVDRSRNIMKDTTKVTGQLKNRFDRSKSSIPPHVSSFSQIQASPSQLHLTTTVNTILKELELSMQHEECPSFNAKLTEMNNLLLSDTAMLMPTDYNDCIKCLAR